MILVRFLFLISLEVILLAKLLKVAENDEGRIYRKFIYGLKPAGFFAMLPLKKRRLNNSDGAMSDYDEAIRLKMIVDQIASCSEKSCLTNL